MSLATSQLVGNNREFDVSGTFSPVLPIVGGRELMTIEDPSLSTHGYQLLSLATSQLVGTGHIWIIQNGSLQRVLFELSGFYELKYMF